MIAPLQQRLWSKWRTLAKDKEFVWETARLKWNLTRAYFIHPEEIKTFFKPEFYPPAPHIRTFRQRVSRLVDPHLKTVLPRYIQYVERFAVTMTLSEKPPYFRVHGLVPFGSKFHVRLLRDGFEPFSAPWWDGQTPLSEFFESDDVKAPAEVQKLIDAGVAKYVQVDDSQHWSVLRQMIDFAYDPNILTFVFYSAQPPALLCLVGENASVDDTWRKAASVIREFQQTQYARTRAGRSSDLPKLIRTVNYLLRRPAITNKTAAAALAKPPFGQQQIFSKVSELSQIKRKLQM